MVIYDFEIFSLNNDYAIFVGLSFTRVVACNSFCVSSRCLAKLKYNGIQRSYLSARCKQCV